MGSSMTPGEHLVPLTDLGDQFATLRLATEEHQRAITQSLQRHGQLTCVMVFPGADGRREVIDGFKRLRAARVLGWAALRVQLLDGNDVSALAAVATLCPEQRPVGRRPMLTADLPGISAAVDAARTRSTSSVRWSTST